MLCIPDAHCRIPGILSANYRCVRILNAHTYRDWSLMCEDWRIGNIGIRGANPLTLKNSYWLLLWKAFTIGPMSADQQNKLESGEEHHH
jgi:hypothetical protein